MCSSTRSKPARTERSVAATDCARTASMSPRSISLGAGHPRWNGSAVARPAQELHSTLPTFGVKRQLAFHVAVLGLQPRWVGVGVGGLCARLRFGRVAIVVRHGRRSLLNPRSEVKPFHAGDVAPAV